MRASDNNITMLTPARKRKLLWILAILILVSVLFFTHQDTSSSTHSDLYTSQDTRQNNEGTFNSFVNNLKFSSGKSTNQNSPHKTSAQQDENIIAKEQFRWQWDMPGYCFDEKGTTVEIKTRLTSALIHSFSPYVERESAKRFVDPPHTNIYYANSPAVKWRNGRIIMVSRIWLERERYEEKQNWPANHFADNWLYTQQYDRTMTPVTNASIMGIPAPKQWWVGDGPIEPRVCAVKDKFFITFNAAMAFDVQQYMDYTILWDYDLNLPIIPRIKGGTPMCNATEKDDMPRDKHWMALVQNDELYFVHNLEPLRVLHCELDGYCEFVHNEVNQENFIFEHSVSHLRGGTPFEPYQYPYYVSIAHSTMYKRQNSHRFYTAHLVVLCVQPYRILYLSNDLKIHPEIYNKIPIVRWKYIDEGFIFPVGLIIENPDTMTVGVHVSDHSSVLIRYKGLKALMSKVIAQDQSKEIKRGPPIGHLNKHLHEIMEFTFNTTFVH